MDHDYFTRSARAIAARNTNGNTVAITARLASADTHATIIYYTSLLPTEDDREECELTCGEILGEFPEIRTAATHCRVAGLAAPHGDEIALFP